MGDFPRRVTTFVGSVNRAPVLAGVVAEVASFFENSKRLQLPQLLWILRRPLVTIIALLTVLEERPFVGYIVSNIRKSQLRLLPWRLQILWLLCHIVHQRRAIRAIT